MIGTATLSAKPSMKPAITAAMVTQHVEPAGVSMPAAGRSESFDQINRDARAAAFRRLGTSFFSRA